MSLDKFIKDEIDISKFKLKNLHDLSRPYKVRLAEIEREFLQIDFINLVKDEDEARQAIKLFRTSRPLFYRKYKNASESIINFKILKDTTLNRKRFLIKKIEDLLSGNMEAYEKNISDIFSYSSIVKKRQVSRFSCGIKSLGMYSEMSMKNIYEEVKDLSRLNILYAKSLIDNLVDSFYENWYSNYNEVIDIDSNIKLKKMKILLDREIVPKDIVPDGYLISTNIKKIGNEHLKIVHLDLVGDEQKDVRRSFTSNLCGISDSNFKMLKLIKINEKSKTPNVIRVKLLTTSTRSESVSIESLDPFVRSFCDSISQEYHSL